MSIDKEDLKKILTKASALEKGKEIALAKEFIGIEDKIDSLSEELKKKDFITTELKGEKGDEGQRGDDGIDGKDYILTAKDKKEIAKSIEVPVVTKEIETIVEKQPIVTNEIKEVAMYENREEIVKKINTGTKDSLKIESSQVAGFDKKTKDLDFALGVLDQRTKFLINKPSGTVTSVSIVTANGISGSVANQTTTPAITLDILALDVSKIADGSITNTEFQYLNGLTSNIQDQLDAIEAGDVDSVNGLTGAVALTGTANRITISAANVFDISASYLGQSSITTLGTITTGVWNGTAITNANLANSSLTIGSTNIALGATSTVLAGLTQLDVDNLRLDGNTISSTSGNIVITPLTGSNITLDGTTIDAGVWTFPVDTNFALTGGINGFSIDGTTFSVDGSNNRAGFGTATPAAAVDILGPTPASVGTSPGTDADDTLNVLGGVGGDTSIATTGVGGVGSSLNRTAGAGGVANSATTSSTGGRGGDISDTGGRGGASSVSSSNPKNGGNGGPLIYSAGTGGSATGAGTGTNTGGTGGPLQFFSGIGGLASTGTGTLQGGDGGPITFAGGQGGAGNTGTGGTGASINFNAGVGGSGSTPGVGGSIVFKTAATTSLLTRITVLNTGEVGINTSTPYSNLDVSATTGGVLTLSRNDTALAANNVIGQINFWTNDTQTTTNPLAAQIQVIAKSTISTDINPGIMKFLTTPSTVAAALTEAMRIDENQNVGIGVTTITASLHLRAGSATANTAPLQFTTGTLETTARIGVMEYNNDLHFTNWKIVRYSVGGTIFEHIVDASKGGAEADIYTNTLIANTLGTNGDKVIAMYGGNFVTGGTELTQLLVQFAGTTIWDSTGLAPATGTTSWRVYVEIIRVSSTVIRYTVSLNTTGATGYVYCTSGELTGLTLSNTNVLRIRGASSGVGSGGGDIVGKMGYVLFSPAT